MMSRCIVAIEKQRSVSLSGMVGTPRLLGKVFIFAA